MTSLLPRAPLREVLSGRAPLVGARCDPLAPRGCVSPVEARVLLGIPYGDLAADEASYLRQRSLWSDGGILARTAFARLLASPRTGAGEARPFLVSARVDSLCIDKAVEAICEPHDLGRARIIHFVHPHALNLARFQPLLRDRLACADRVLPDGIGLRLAARITGARLAHNLNGTDLLPLLCRDAAARSRPLVLVGGARGVAEEAREALRAATPALEVPIVSDGFLSEERRRALVQRIERLGSCIVLIGMGSPLQEQFAHDHLAHLPGVTLVTVGGLFDFYAGRVPRAPVLVRELGLEWLFRLMQEPRRLAGRYLLGNPLFLSLAVLQRLAS